ncbi:MAG: Gfo/Idh/MocA family oxidoreductase [Candidatus Latescibacteria bacterium]|jgi:predicted dehydrogenase|nr:Gfo/Idh/MocA family oxidoreductase [Candidatus Latescibacterota bacterium]
MAKLGLGVIGCGNMGASLAKGARDLDCAQVVCVSDVDGEKGQTLADEMTCHYEADYRVMLARDDVQAVLIATPPFLHTEPAVAAAEAGVHVFCEKPMAPTLKDCDTIIAACEAGGVKLGIGLVCRFHPVHRKVRDLAQGGELGDPTCLMVHRLGGGWGGKWAATWRESLSQSGGTLMEINAHEIDFLRFVMGDAESVSAAGGQFVQMETDFPDVALVSVRFKNGGVGMLHSSQASAIGGYGGRLDCAEGSVVFPTFWGSEGGLRYKRHDGEESAIAASELAGKEDPVSCEIRAFSEAVLDGKEPPVSGADGRAAVEIALAAYRSIETGETVKLPFSE